MELKHLTRPVQGVLLDWAGTTIDYGSRAPTEVFVELFRLRGVAITEAEARGPMGQAKLDHIAAIAALPRVANAWAAVHGRAPDRSDVIAMYEQFLPMQQAVLSRGAEVLPGIPAAIQSLRARGVKIGSTTGYTRALMEVVAPLAAAGGYAPEALVCADDVPAGRPAPDMNRRAMTLLNLTDPAAVLVVDDTPVGIAAGRAAGCPTIAVSQTGNALGLSLADVMALAPADLIARLDRITAEFLADGADYVLRSVADLPELLARIEPR